MKNKEVAKHLTTIGQLYALTAKNRFRQRTFEDAARTIGEMNIPIEEAIHAKLPGVGASVIETVSQFLSDGESDRLTTLSQEWPVEALTMTAVDGVGPKTAMKLHGEGIKNFNELVAAAEAGKLKDRLFKAVEFARDKSQGRIVHSLARYLSEWVDEEMGDVVTRLQVCGSIRRKKSTSKDVDIVVIADDKQAAFDKFISLGEEINRGDRKASIRATYRATMMQVDLWVVEPWHWGAAILYATGCKEHVKNMRALAQRNGHRLNEYGLFNRDVETFTEENQLAGEEEQDIYGYLGLQYVEPLYRARLWLRNRTIERRERRAGKLACQDQED